MPNLRDYLGRAVRLTDERLAHIHEHPEMSGLDGAIATTLERPHRVVHSTSDENAELFCRLLSHTVVGEKYLCVVTKRVDADAFVLTAYLTDGINPGVTIWPRST